MQRKVVDERKGMNEDIRTLNHKIVMLESDLIYARAGIDLDWASILVSKEFAPYRDIIFQIALYQFRERVLTVHPNLDLTILDDKEEGEAIVGLSEVESNEI